MLSEKNMLNIIFINYSWKYEKVVIALSSLYPILLFEEIEK
jgi:hypothetical protein